MKKNKILLMLAIIAAAGAFFAFDLGELFSLEYFKSQQAGIAAYFQTHPLQSALIYFAVYVMVTALSLPGATVMTLAGGAIFGLLWGFMLVSLASTIGATLAFLVARFLLRDTVQYKFSRNLKTINEGIKKDGAFYLFTLRLVPAFPFFIINLVMGLTSIKTLTYLMVSWIGMLPGTIVYVNAGTHIAKIEFLSGILSPGLIISFTLLGIFPLIAKKIVETVRARKILRAYAKPKSFDTNLVVIGAGSAGLVSAYIAAAVKAKVTLIEKHKMGGDCLNTGCVPSKALIRSAKFLAQMRRAKEFGIKSANAEFDFAEIMERVQRIIKTVEPHDSVERYTRLGVDCIQGEAKITSPYTVEVNGRTINTRGIIIATGAKPAVPSIPGIEKTDYLTSDTLWDIRELPKKLLVLGGGPIGSELTQCFARLGSKVTVVQRGERIMRREDPEFSEMLMQRFDEEGITLRMKHRPKKFCVENGRKTLVCEHLGNEVYIEFDQLLVATGRTANTQGFGLEELGVSTGRTVTVNEYLQTNFPNIYACGDVAGPYQFTHTAAHQAWYAAVNALFGGLKKFKADYSVIPWATFTDPEIARVGLNEQEAVEKNISYDVTVFDLKELDRAIADEEAHGMVKVLTVPDKDKILGVTIAGEHAGDLIAEYVSAMRHGLGLNKILSTIHIYPTLAEANKFAAGNWKRAHKPEKLLRHVERYHAWLRKNKILLAASSIKPSGHSTN
ncbi:MAG: FAD-dependent oxidoreductase [Gammaproteobacteria bacterium]|nr:FAD-dependent oxidoreductase [Gammaproteobacteria bacterium]